MSTLEERLARWAEGEIYPPPWREKRQFIHSSEAAFLVRPEEIARNTIDNAKSTVRSRQFSYFSTKLRDVP